MASGGPSWQSSFASRTALRTVPASSTSRPGRCSRIHWADPKPSVAPGHINDGEHDVDPDLLMQQHLHCLISTCRLDDFVPAIAQALRDRRPDQNVVLDDKDGF